MEIYECTEKWAGRRISAKERDMLCMMSCCCEREYDYDGVNVEKLVRMGLVYCVQVYDKCYLGLTEVGGFVREVLRK